MLLGTMYEVLQQAHSLKLIAGEKNIRRQMTWFHILEDVEQSSFIRGNELVFTTGVNCYGDEWLISFVKELSKNKACGLVINIGPHIGQISQHIVDLCEHYSLPLFTVPWKVRLVDLTRDLSRLIIESERTQHQSEIAMKSAITNPREDNHETLFKDTGYRLDSRYCVALLSGFDHARYRDDTIRKIRNHLLQSGDCTVFSLDCCIVLIYVESAMEKINKMTHSLIILLKQWYPKTDFYMGVGGNISGISNVAAGYNQAACAMRIAQIDKSDCILYDDIGLYKILFAAEDKLALTQFANEILGEIIRHDKEHKTSYLEWLNLYINCNCSIQRASEEAFCHRNTVNYKIRKIRDLFGIDTNYGEQYAAVMIAFRILKLFDK